MYYIITKGTIHLHGFLEFNNSGERRSVHGTDKDKVQMRALGEYCVIYNFE
jgi:hypothetical protein